MNDPGVGRVTRIIWLVLLLLSACQPRASALRRIQHAGAVRVALDPSFPPFESVAPNGEVQGLDVDLAREIAARLGVEAQFVTIGYDGLYDALTAGRADLIISALYFDPARSRDFVATRPYFDAGEGLVVPQTSEIADFSSLSGKRLAVVYGTSGHMAALGWQKRLEPACRLVPYDTAEEALAALQAGEADAALVDAITAQDLPPTLRLLQPLLTHEPYVIVGRAADADLVSAVDRIVQQMAEDGTLAALIRRRMVTPTAE